MDTSPEIEIRDEPPRDLLALTLTLQQGRAALREQLALRIPRDLSGLLDADDLVQETHIEAFRHFDEFHSRGGGHFRGWLRKIAIHKLRDAIKRHRADKRGGGRAQLVPARDATESTMMLLDALAQESRTPSRSVARLEALGLLERAIQSLPPRYQEAVRLVYIEQRSVVDAAQQTGTSERAIHGLCRRSIKLLRETLREIGISQTAIFGP